MIAGCPGEQDVDGDGLNRSVEQQHGLDDSSVDTDGDGLNDSREFHHPFLDPTTNDTDNDGLLDGAELERDTNVSVPDTDGDGAQDGVEVEVGSDPTKKHSDNDGVNDGDELEVGTSPTRADTDGDGITDDVELDTESLNPLRADTDSDGLDDKKEREIGTDPSKQDTDNDSRNDAVEARSATAATNADTDGDGLSDGVEAPPGEETPFDPTDPDTDDDGLQDDVEKQIGTNPSNADTDGDGRSDMVEYETDGVSPTETDVVVIEGSPDAGLNASLTNTTRQSVQFFAELPENKTRRERVVNQTATTICESHNEVVSGTVGNTSELSSEAYRGTYRVAHSAEVLQDLGADINPGVIQKRMETARRVSGVAGKYAPVIGSYQRLHDASCAVKAGEPGAREDFYIAAAEFTVDLALVEKQVMYKAAFKTTGYAAQKVGLIRLARVCGYKCVGLVESEMYWATHATYSGAIDQVALEATEGNLTTDGWNESVRTELGEYLETTTGSTRIGGQLVSDSQLVDCVNDNLELQTLWKIAGDLSSEGVDAVRVVLNEERIPEDVDLSSLENIESVTACTQR